MLDLHIHSTHSDGHLEIEEIVQLLEEGNITGFSITDHDNIDSIECLEKISITELKNINGVEFGVSYKDEEVHILSYFLNPEDQNILKIFEKLQRSRVKRIYKMISILQSNEIDITKDELHMKAKGNILSRSHIGELLVEKGYAKDMKDAFLRYLGESGIAYIPKKNISIEELLDTIKANKAVAILAHPVTLKNQDVIYDLIKMGIDGIEVINSKHTHLDAVNYYNLARKYHLLMTCGSDCHGIKFEGNYLLGRFLVNNKMMEPIRKLHLLRKKA